MVVSITSMARAAATAVRDEVLSVPVIVTVVPYLTNSNVVSVASFELLVGMLLVSVRDEAPVDWATELVFPGAVRLL